METTQLGTTQLRTNPLGTTDLEITRVGFGAWAVGGGNREFGWGPQRAAGLDLTDQDLTGITADIATADGR